MRRLLIPACLVAVLFLLPQISVHTQRKAPAGPVVVLETVKGVIEIQTLPEDAPKSVAHFVALVEHGFYRGQRFHWVQTGVVQAGDPFSRDLTKQKDWGTGGSGPRLTTKPLGFFEPPKRKFVRGTVGLAYRPNYKPETADSMFFILTGPNPALNGKYVVLGEVTKGMDVVDKIKIQDVIKNVTVR
jgi:peptidylprolyl isomerase